MAMRGPDGQCGRGARLCRRITRRYAKTFYFASACLPRRTRAHAYAIYGFCRWADNAVDDARSPIEAADRLDRASLALDLAYSEAKAAPGLAGAVVGRPKVRALSGVSGRSSVVPSRPISRQPR